MIKRTYFFKVESLQMIQEERRRSGKITCCTGFINSRSWFPKSPGELANYAITKSESIERDFLVGEIILTALSRV